MMRNIISIASVPVPLKPIVVGGRVLARRDGDRRLFAYLDKMFSFFTETELLAFLFFLMPAAVIIRKG
jgi:hypothetical protein